MNKKLNSYFLVLPGPWCVGEILTGKYGLIWVHGVQISTHFIPGSLTYLFGGMQVVHIGYVAGCIGVRK